MHTKHMSPETLRRQLIIELWRKRQTTRLRRISIMQLTEKNEMWCAAYQEARWLYRQALITTWAAITTVIVLVGLVVSGAVGGKP